MNINDLLYAEESSTLDFKEEQYKFINVSNEYIKSELLKDILAFANAWRDSDAYILIGVREIKGGKSQVVGINEDEDIDDATLQQFIKNKVNRPITFRYCTIEINEKRIAYFHIPIQKRPFYSKKEYGKVKANVVYLRRGSSTDTASPDEISDMGKVNIDNNLIPTNPVDYKINARLTPIYIDLQVEVELIKKNIKEAEEEIIYLNKSIKNSSESALSSTISKSALLSSLGKNETGYGKRKPLDIYNNELKSYKVELEKYIEAYEKKLLNLSNYLSEYTQDKYFIELFLENIGHSSDTNIDVSVDIHNGQIIEGINILSYSKELNNINYPKKPSKNYNDIVAISSMDKLLRPTLSKIHNLNPYNPNAYCKNIKILDSLVSVNIRDMNVGDKFLLVNNKLFIEVKKDSLKIEVTIKAEFNPQVQPHLSGIFKF